jgi:hypothetical protein
MANGFFLATRNAAQRLSDAYDFFWPAKAGLWTLRWQVLGYLQEIPNATEEELNARFVRISRDGDRRFRGIVTTCFAPSCPSISPW